MEISVESPIYLTLKQSGLAQGAPGVPGESGVDGKSAYEIAVENGFIGSEQEWLASLSEDSWIISQFDSATGNILLCANRMIYIIDASIQPVTAIVPDVNLVDFSCRIILNNNTHKVTVTTPLGETLIGNDTSQVIPLESGQLYLMYSVDDGKYYIISDTRQSMENASFTPYKNIDSINGQSALEKVYDLSIGDTNCKDDTVLDNISLTEYKIERINLTPIETTLSLGIASHPIQNGQKLLIVNNATANNLTINMPTGSVVIGSITYIYKNIDTVMTLNGNLSCEINFINIFVSETLCEIRITFVNFV